jgi:hypothetical protein
MPRIKRPGAIASPPQTPSRRDTSSQTQILYLEGLTEVKNLVV